LFFALAVVAFGVLVEFRSAYAEHRMTDLGCYLRAGWAVRSGADIYDVTDDNGWHYAYPPVFAIAMTPLADAPNGYSRIGSPPYALSVALWFVFSVICVALAVHWVAKTLEENSADPAIRNMPTGCRRWWTLRIAPVLICMAPVGCTLARGQANLILVMLIAGMYRATVRKRHFASGLWLAAAICLKLIPGFLLIIPVVRRDARALAAAAFGLLLGVVVIPALVWGPARAFDVHERMLDAIIGPALIARGNHDRDKELIEITATDNQSIQAVLHTYEHWKQSTRPSVASPETKVAHWLIGGLLTLAVCVGFQTSTDDEAIRLLFFIGGLALVMVLISPVSHTHYFCLALPLVTAHLANLTKAPSLQQPRFPFWIVILAGVLFALPMIPVWERRREIGLSLLGSLILLGWAIRRLSPVASQQKEKAYFSANERSTLFAFPVQR
jgi:hypothetical protein